VANVKVNEDMSELCSQNYQNYVKKAHTYVNELF